MTQTMDTYGALTRRMDFLAARQATITGNIANANTPGYLSRDLQMKPAEGGTSFAMAMTNAKHLQAARGVEASGKVVEDSTNIQHNGNSVRLDEEMLKMNQTQGDYRLMTELYSKMTGMQKLAVGRQ